jgi:prepilin-type processing-associated H-X9-DG protein
LVDYIFCKGVTDAFCLEAETGVAPAERGMFDFSLYNGINNITDGLSNTIAMGEGAGGTNWKICGSENGLDRDLYPCDRPDEMNPIASYINQAGQAWLPGQVNSDPFPLVGLKVTSLFGCTAEALNHPGGANFLFADGSVQYLPESINSIIDYSKYSTVGFIGGVYQALSTRAGGEPNVTFE